MKWDALKNICNRFSLLSILIIYSSSTLLGQNKEKKELSKYVESITYDTNMAHKGIATSVKFTQNSHFTIADFEKNYAELLQITNDNSLIKVKAISGHFIKDVAHHYQQYYKGVPVYGAGFVLGEKSDNGMINGLSRGYIVHGLSVNVKPQFSEETALNSALNSINAKTYLWQDTKAENLLKKIKNDTKASHYPKGELILKSFPFSTKPEDYKLCYKFRVETSIPHDSFTIYIDAISGEVIQKSSNKRK